jgi:HlyD family secretion protein
VKKALIAGGVLIIVVVLVVLNLRKEGLRVDVEVVDVQLRAISKVVTASGRIQAKRQVEVSASAIGKVVKLAVKEGDYVKAGDFLLQIDPTPYQSAVDELQASIRSADAQVEMEEASLAKAEYDLARAKTLHRQNVVSEDEVRTAQLNYDVAKSRVKTVRETLAQHEANLKKARHDLEQVRITADISGVVTELNVEEGENAIMGTLNNPGTVLLVIADLSEIEAEVEVDETEVVSVRLGQKATVTLDAYPDDSFNGVVAEVGNSAIRTQIGLGQSSVDFKVVISIQDSIPNVRPGLSASAKIQVAEVRGVRAVPIQCLTIRRRTDLPDTFSADTTSTDDVDVEGVFVVDGGTARYRKVDVGIAGSEYFEVLDGLTDGETVVSGPFKAINELKDGDPVKTRKAED